MIRSGELFSVDAVSAYHAVKYFWNGCGPTVQQFWYCLQYPLYFGSPLTGRACQIILAGEAAGLAVFHMALNGPLNREQASLISERLEATSQVAEYMVAKNGMHQYHKDQLEAVSNTSY